MTSDRVDVVEVVDRNGTRSCDAEDRLVEAIKRLRLRKFVDGPVRTKRSVDHFDTSDIRSVKRLRVRPSQVEELLADLPDDTFNFERECSPDYGDERYGDVYKSVMASDDAVREAKRQRAAKKQRQYMKQAEWRRDNASSRPRFPDWLGLNEIREKRPRMHQLFHKLRLNYRERFELVLFLLGNGRDPTVWFPHLLRERVISPEDKFSIVDIIKKFDQGRIDPKWRYFDMHKNRWAYVLDGTIVPDRSDRLSYRR